ncbi:UNVERIFIED_CONTAM: hypothetical protein PYX00_005756 [Menopon gallinae]
MIKINYHDALGGWQKPSILPVENISLHPAAKVLHYAIELFEGMKAYRGVDDKIRMFRPDLNMKRMNDSASRSGLPNFDSGEMIKLLARLLQIDQEWVPHSPTASLYIRPTLIGIDPQLGMTASESALLFAICSPVNSYFKEGFQALSLLADPKYTRSWPGGCGDKKMGSNYAPTVQVQREAFALGFQQVLWLYGEEDYVTEAGTMNIFIIIKSDDGQKELITPPLNGLILPGVTRASILDVAREQRRMKVTERDITMKEMIQLSKKGRILEMFGAGTACIVSPIASIEYKGERYKIPTMEHDEKEFENFLKTLTSIQYGHIKHPWGFCIDDYCKNGT